MSMLEPCTPPSRKMAPVPSGLAPAIFPGAGDLASPRPIVGRAIPFGAPFWKPPGTPPRVAHVPAARANPTDAARGVVRPLGPPAETSE